MKGTIISSFVVVAALLTSTISAFADDLNDVLTNGELRHIGIRYANFVTGSGDGFDVELAQGFAHHLGVRYQYVDSSFSTVIRDLLGQDVVRNGTDVTLDGAYPVKGDMIAAGFTILPWRERVLLYSKPTFPSQVLLIARAESATMPIHGSAVIDRDIAETKGLIGRQTLLVMRKTCLDPSSYGLSEPNFAIREYTRSTNLNEMVPALLDGSADFTLLDVPDVLLDVQKWAGRIKIIGPISGEQRMGAAFRPTGTKLRDAFNEYLVEIKADGSYDRLVLKYYPEIRSYFPEFFGGAREK